MAIIEQTYNLDLVPNGKPLVVNVSQYDVGSRALTFNLYKDNIAFSPPSGYAAHISGTKPDGTGFMYAMTVSGSAVTAEVTQQMTAVAGDCPCEIRLIDGSGNVLGTSNFTLAVEKAAMDDDTVISDSDIPYFEDLARQAAESAAKTEALFPEGGSVGQVLTKTADGTEWGDGGHGDVSTVDGFAPDTNGAVTTERVLTQAQYDALSESEKNNGMTYYISDGEGGGASSLVVNITYANGAYSADKTFAQIMANINSGGYPVAKYQGSRVLYLVGASATQVIFGEFPQNSGIGEFYISSANVVTFAVRRVSVTEYYATTLGSASATSDSTIYTNGYKLTVTSANITVDHRCNVVFPNGDYSGNVTWITGTGKVDLYFDQNPNSKSIRVEWKTLTYTSASIS